MAGPSPSTRQRTKPPTNHLTDPHSYSGRVVIKIESRAQNLKESRELFVIHLESNKERARDLWSVLGQDIDKERMWGVSIVATVSRRRIEFGSITLSE